MNPQSARRAWALATSLVRSLLLTALLAALAVGCARTTLTIEPPETFALADPVSRLARQIDARFEDPAFAHAHWGVLIQSLETGRVWYERNANRLFIPASNQKIPTAAAALLALGPDFRFETALCHTGALDGATLRGDLVVFGNGDPTLYTHFFDDPRDVFRGWAQTLRERGLRRITGDVIGDDNTFEDQHLGQGWSFDGLAEWYSAEFGPLQINENYVDLTIIPPTDVSGEVRIEPNLPSHYYTVVNGLQVVEHGRDRVQIDRAPGSNVIVLRGTVVAGHASFEESPTITNPTLFYVTVLTEVLEEAGIEVDGEPRDCDDIPGWDHTAADLPRLATHLSPPLSDILKGLMKRSQNMYAETLVRTLGWHHTGVGSFEAGREEVEAQLEAFGLAPGTYAYRDGSGLSRYNWISPRHIVEILRGMRRSAVWEVWRDSLPIAGVDGTLRLRMRGTAAEGNVRAKTGTLSNVRALSGYVTTADGEEIVFSMLVNGHLLPTSAPEAITDDVLAMIAGFDRRSPAQEPVP